MYIFSHNILKKVKVELTIHLFKVNLPMDPEDFVLDMFNEPVKKLNVFSATYLVKPRTRTNPNEMNGSTMKSAVRALIFNMRIQLMNVFSVSWLCWPNLSMSSLKECLWQKKVPLLFPFGAVVLVLLWQEKGVKEDVEFSPVLLFWHMNYWNQFLMILFEALIPNSFCSKWLTFIFACEGTISFYFIHYFVFNWIMTHNNTLWIKCNCT